MMLEFELYKKKMFEVDLPYQIEIEKIKSEGKKEQIVTKEVAQQGREIVSKTMDTGTGETT